jgi:subtilisin family serine protease
MSRRSTIKTLEPLETRLFLTTTPNDPRYAEEWGLAAIGASSAWDTTTGSAAVVVADIDTGMQYTHPDLYLNTWINQAEIPAAVKRTLVDTDRDGVISFYDLNASANRGKVNDVDHNGRIDAADVLTRSRYGGWADGADQGRNSYVDDIIGWDFANNDRSPMDFDGHGTHTAGTIAATGNNATGVTGVAWRASLMAVKIFDDQGYAADDPVIAAAIRYSANNGARVSNNSWGGPGYSNALYNAINYAASKGQVFVAAAGNDSVNTDYYDDNYPANFDLDNIISVASTNSRGELSYFSNWGQASVDVAAPGSSILSTYLGSSYARLSGTSMATPQVTGTVALMLTANPSLSVSQIKSRIINGADQSASLYRTSVSSGELNTANALANRTGTRYTPPSTNSRRGTSSTTTTRSTTTRSIASAAATAAATAVAFSIAPPASFSTIAIDPDTIFS